VTWFLAGAARRLSSHTHGQILLQTGSSSAPCQSHCLAGPPAAFIPGEILTPRAGTPHDHLRIKHQRAFGYPILASPASVIG
jgi:hypothetical protein